MIRELLDEEWYDVGDKFRFSQVLFSDNLTEGNHKRRIVPGEILAKYIRDNKLGILIESRPIKNRNTGNKIKTWVWNVTNMRKLRKTVGWKKPESDYDHWR